MTEMERFQALMTRGFLITPGQYVTDNEIYEWTVRKVPMPADDRSSTLFKESFLKCSDNIHRMCLYAHTVNGNLCWKPYFLTRDDAIKCCEMLCDIIHEETSESLPETEFSVNVRILDPLGDKFQMLDPVFANNLQSAHEKASEAATNSLHNCKYPWEVRVRPR